MLEPVRSDPDGARSAPSATLAGAQFGLARRRWWPCAVSVVAIRSHSNGPVAATSTPPATATPASAAPRYYAAVTPFGGKSAADGLAVADTSTGKTVATVAPPAGRTFTSVSRG